MTTIVRQDDIVYSDSCWGAPVGSERARVIGVPKLLIDEKKHFLVGVTGTMPGNAVADFITGPLIPELNKFLKDPVTRNTYKIIAISEAFFTAFVEKHKYIRENFIIVFFTKKVTLQMSVSVNRHKCTVRTMSYTNFKDLAWGSGSTIWHRTKHIDCKIMDRFKMVYAIDGNSGGDVYGFDLNQLKEFE